MGVWVSSEQKTGLSLKALLGKDSPDNEGHWLLALIESLLNEKVRVSASKNACLTHINLLTPFSARMLLIPQNRVANLEEKLAGGDWLVRKLNNQVTLHWWKIKIDCGKLISNPNESNQANV